VKAHRVLVSWGTGSWFVAVFALGNRIAAFLNLYNTAVRSK